MTRPLSFLPIVLRGTSIRCFPTKSTTAESVVESIVPTVCPEGSFTATPFARSAAVAGVASKDLGVSGAVPIASANGLSGDTDGTTFTLLGGIGVAELGALSDIVGAGAAPASEGSAGSVSVTAGATSDLGFSWVPAQPVSSDIANTAIFMASLQNGRWNLNAFRLAVLPRALESNEENNVQNERDIRD